jgi:hypothetical protein
VPTGSVDVEYVAFPELSVPDPSRVVEVHDNDGHE